MKVGESIRIARTRRGLRQGDLASRLGMSQSFLSLIETGKRQPTVRQVEDIAAAMEIPAQLIFLMACDVRPEQADFKPALERLSLTMLDLLEAVRKPDA